ncbi:hypothetical protein D6C80_04509 [Aureobasidium pullulans]|nr:hypothetical protein D6C80_04509 [Aureobasidium pullulans]
MFLDYPVHRTLCKTYQHFQRRPNSNMRRAIFFPVKSEARFVWIEMDQLSNQPDFERIKKKCFKNSNCSIEKITIDEDLVYIKKLNPQIVLVCRANSASDGSAVNQSLSRLNDETCTSWKGPVLAYGSEMKMNAAGQETTMCTDLDTTDLGSINNWIMGPLEPRKPFHGSVIFSHGESSKRGRRFDSATLQSLPGVAKVPLSLESQIAYVFGMPLMIMFKIPADTTASKEYEEIIKAARSDMPSDSYNSTAGLLLMDLENKDSDASHFAEIPERYIKKSLGDAIVVRKDGRPLETAQLEAFCNWVEHDLLPLFTDARLSIAEELNVDPAADSERWKKRADFCLDLRQKMLARITRKRFYGWCEKEGLNFEHF